MNCNDVENLLPRFVEGDTSEKENILVEKHLATCERCRESHKLYAALEESLRELRTELPSPRAVSSMVIKRLHLGRRRAAFRAILNTPVITSLLLVASSIIMLVYRGAVMQFLLRMALSSTSAIVGFSNNLPVWIMRIAGGETWVLLTVYILLTLLISLTGGLTAIRFAHK
ncbi:MAG: zf-HC2 domain-containing protein [Candidatus Krumholzibacteria bacterium]|nr:zf-HC2 domain-containing protein [Candidatus Krumholzibacteria bacterium]